MKIQARLIPIVIVLLTLVSGGSPAMATDEISEREELECQVCHSDPDRSIESLNDQGLYFQYLETLEGYDQVLGRFESCTYCHVDQAGSQALTGEGHRFRWMMEDMAGLRAWLDENHPKPAEEEANDQG